MFDNDEEPALYVKEIKSYKINQTDPALNGYLLEKDKSFLIHGFNYFLIYDSKTFELLQEKNFDKRITYISIIDNKRFLISFEHNYEYYKLKNDKYECTNNVNLEKELKKVELSAITLLKEQTKVACGEGKLISIRELESGKLIKTLTKHEGSLQVLFIHKDYLVSCCSYLNLCFWNLENFEFLNKLEVDIMSPTSYLIMKNTLDDIMITGGYSFLNKVDLDVLTKEGEASEGLSLIQGLVQLNHIYVLVASQNELTQKHNFYLLDVDEMSLQLMVENAHEDFCDACIKIGDKQFVSICRDLTFKVWEIKDKAQDSLDNLSNLLKK